MSRYRPKIVQSTALDAISTFYSETENLREECQEVVDNAPNENIPRIQTLQDACDALDFSEVDFPRNPAGEPWEELPCSYTASVLGGRGAGRESRAVRCANAVAAAQAGLEALRERVETLREAHPDEEADSELLGLLEDVESYCDEVESHVEAADSAEFPGMMG